MRLVAVKITIGPSTLAPKPVVHLALRADGLARWPGGAAAEALLRVLPGLADHPADGGAGTFARALAAPSTISLGLVVARVATELLRLHGDPRHEVGLHCSADGTQQDAFFGYRDPDIAVRAGKVAVSLVLAALPADLRPAGSVPENFDPTQARDRFLAQADAAALDQTTAGIVAEAARRDIPWRLLDRPMRLVQFGQGRHLRRLQESVTDRTGAIASKLQRDKMRTVRLLGRMQLPVPRHALADSVEEAMRQAQQIGLPVVVKPLDSTKGRGITLDVGDAAALRAAYDVARRHSERVLIESFIAGSDHRALVVGGNLVAVAKRLPAAVTGDGQRSVSELVAEANRDPRRGRGFKRLLTFIELDAQADALLRKQGYTRDILPGQGALVALRATANISTGGTAVDVTDAVHPDNRVMLERAARVIGLDVVGIDFITPDIAHSYREVGGAICEVNASPGLRPHQIAAQVPGAPPRDVVGAIVEQMFPGGGNGRIPTAAITGTNGKTTTARMLAHILRQAGGEIGVATVGLTTTHGASINGVTVATGDLASLVGARVLLEDPSVEAAVLETARGGIVTTGLGFDWCDVGAVLNVDADHLGLDGIESLEDLAAAKQRVAEAARHLAVLNADDPRCLAMATLKPAAQVCLFSLQPPGDTLRAHVAAGGLAITVAETDGRETLLIHRRGGGEPLLASADIPASLGGAARHNLQNAMAAAGLALGLGLSPAGIAAALARFKGDHGDNPGRLNFIDGLPFKVVHDAAHNPHGMRALCSALRDLTVEGRRICVISGTGYRHGEHIEEIAGIIAGAFDHFVCSRLEQVRRPHLVARDFPLEEVPQRLAAALVAAGVDPARVETVDLDKAAVDRGLALAGAGDLVALLTGLVDWTRERVLAHAAKTKTDEPSGAAGRPI